MNCRSAPGYSFLHRLSEDVRVSIRSLFEKAKKSGYVRVIVDGNMYESVGGDSDG